MVFVKAEKLQRLARILQEVQRLIEEAGGEPGQIEETLARTADRVGMDLSVARLMDLDTLQRLLAPGPHPDPGRAWVVGEVLYLDAIRARAEGRYPESRDRLVKARRLYRLVEDASPRLPEGAAPAADRLRDIEAILEGNEDRGGAGP